MTENKELEEKIKELIEIDKEIAEKLEWFKNRNPENLRYIA